MRENIGTYTLLKIIPHFMMSDLCCLYSHQHIHVMLLVCECATLPGDLLLLVVTSEAVGNQVICAVEAILQCNTAFKNHKDETWTTLEACQPP
jgi:hypothetical protein